MLGFFNSRCPVPIYDQAWIETRMQWLAEQFGVRQLRTTDVIVPTVQFFPEPWPATEGATRKLFQQFCDWMKIPRDHVSLEFDLDHPSPEVGVQRPTIQIAQGLIEQPPQLAATIARKLSRELLVGQGRLSPDVPDCEQITELLPIFFGLGVLLANATITETHEVDLTIERWELNRMGFLSSQQLGYALALFAWCRQEFSPRWARELRQDAGSTLKAGLRYLKNSPDCLFQPDQLSNGQPLKATWAVVEQLSSKNPARRLATVWKLWDAIPTDAIVIEALARLVEDHDRSPVVAAAAVKSLSAVTPSLVQPATQVLISALASSYQELQVAALQAFAKLHFAREQVIPEIVCLLSHENVTIVKEAALALATFGDLPHSATKALVQRLTRAVLRSEWLEDTLARALYLASPNPESEIAACLDPDDDPELYRQVIAIVAEARTAIKKEKEPSLEQRN